MKLDNGRSTKEQCVFTNIGELFSLARAAKREGRHILFDDLDLIRNAAFVTSQSKILWIGEKKKLPKEFSKIKKEVSFKGASLLPGFVESHTHLLFAGNRAQEFDWRNQGKSYQEIAKQGGGILSTLSQTRSAKPAELLKLGQKRLNEFVRQGVTTLEVKSGYAQNFEGEKKLLKVAGQLKNIRVLRTYLGAHALPPEFKTPEDYVENLIRNDLPKIKSQKLATRVDIFIENGFFSKQVGQKYLRAAKELGFELSIHAEQLTLSGGADLALELSALSADHLIQIGEKEIAKLARSNVTCTLLPASDLYMKCSYPPARALIDAGARVALATDFNPGTCPTQDLSLVGVLARIEMKMSLAEVISAYTIGGAFALGLQDEMGSLEVGKSANFIVLNSNLDELFYQIGQSPVCETWFEAKKVFAFN